MPHLLDALRDWLVKPKPYRARHFRKREELRGDYGTLADGLLEVVDFDTALDVGCANGFLLERFRSSGKEVAGIERSPEVRKVLPRPLAEVVAVGDFAEVPKLWSRRFDLVCCVEVAEHVEPHRSEELVEVLAGQAGRWIYFTAAPLGQSGHGHINLRPHDEWLSWFEDRGWQVAPDEVSRLRRALDRLERAHWLRDNSFLLRPGISSPGR